MPSARDVFVKCDELELLPDENRRNYLFELEWLTQELPTAATVLQVGSMDGMRALRMLEARPDLLITGLEIESELVSLATDTLNKRSLPARFIHGDITAPPTDLTPTRYVICLNNTLGYIPEGSVAIEQMKRYGENVVVSVYGERFDDSLARRYFESIGLAVRELKDDAIIFRDFSSVKRFTRASVAAWGGHTILDTPIGYLTVLSGHPSE
jgi:hypothetical protein